MINQRVLAINTTPVFFCLGMTTDLLVLFLLNLPTRCVSLENNRLERQPIQSRGERP